MRPSGPFDRAYAEQNGATSSPAFDSAQVSRRSSTPDDPAARADGRRAVRRAVLAIPHPGRRHVRSGTDPVRSAHGGRPRRSRRPVDRLNLWHGRWPTAPGEIVLNEPPGDRALRLGARLERARRATADGGRLRLQPERVRRRVGHARADGRPAPDATQMLYRFATPATDGQLRAALAEVRPGLPSRALLGSQPYLGVASRACRQVANAYVPYLAAFGHPRPRGGGPDRRQRRQRRGRRRIPAHRGRSRRSASRRTR